MIVWVFCIYDILMLNFKMLVVEKFFFDEMGFKIDGSFEIMVNNILLCYMIVDVSFLSFFDYIFFYWFRNVKKNINIKIFVGVFFIIIILWFIF